MKTVSVLVNGPGSGRESAESNWAGLKVALIKDELNTSQWLQAIKRRRIVYHVSSMRREVYCEIEIRACKCIGIGRV